MNDFNFGEHLKLVRQKEDITQEWMAFNLKMSQSSYSRIEASAAVPDHKLFSKILKVLNVEAVDLLPDYQNREPVIESGVEGNGIAYQVKLILTARVGIFIVLSSGIVIVNAVFDLVTGFCEGLGTSRFVMYAVGGTFATLTSLYLIYWFWNFKKNAK